MLERIAALDIALIIVVRDKQTMASLPKDLEDLYRQAAGRTVRLCVERWQQLEIVLDKRYTQENICAASWNGKFARKLLTSLDKQS